MRRLEFLLKSLNFMCLYFYFSWFMCVWGFGWFRMIEDLGFKVLSVMLMFLIRIFFIFGRFMKVLLL